MSSVIRHFACGFLPRLCGGWLFKKTDDPLPAWLFLVSFFCKTKIIFSWRVHTVQSETAHRPATNDPRLNASFNPDFHGTSGPVSSRRLLMSFVPIMLCTHLSFLFLNQWLKIHTSHPQWISGLNIPFFDALETLGVHRNPDAVSQSPKCMFLTNK